MEFPRHSTLAEQRQQSPRTSQRLGRNADTIIELTGRKCLSIVEDWIETICGASYNGIIGSHRKKDENAVYCYGTIFRIP